MTCVEVRQHVDTLLEPRYGKDPEKLRKLGHAVTKHCLDDKWTPSLRKCVVDTRSLDDGHHCLDALPADQRTAFETAMETAAKDPPVADPNALPAACLKYRDLMLKLSTCDKLPQASRDAMKDAFEQAWKAFSDVPPEGREALGESCKSAVDAMEQTMMSLSCG